MGIEWLMIKILYMIGKDTGKESIVYMDVTSKNTVSTPAKILH